MQAIWKHKGYLKHKEKRKTTISQILLEESH